MHKPLLILLLDNHESWREMPHLQLRLSLLGKVKASSLLIKDDSALPDLRLQRSFVTRENLNAKRDEDCRTSFSMSSS